MDIANYIDHTNLKQDADKKDIERLCQEAAAYGFASVCVNSSYVPLSVKLLHGTGVKVCTVVGFPLGAMSSRGKAMEARQAIADGAVEIDMVAHIGMIKSRDYGYVEQDIREVAAETIGRAILKVIIETCLLTDQEKQKVCLICKDAGADFVKTSTGFSAGGADVRDVALMRQTVGSAMGVKASGGVRTAQCAKEMLEAGATRLGTSSGAEIINGFENND